MAKAKRQAILFLVDTQGADVLGCTAGDTGLGTVRLDRLAGEGVRFTRAMTCSPVCGPARSAIFTGLFPHANGVVANDLAPHLDLPTLGQRLAREGIRAGYAGKWHLDGTDYFGNGRCPPGWDPATWFDGRNYLDSLPDDASRLLSRRVLGPKEVAEHGITAEFTHAHRIADRAIRFLREHADEDFLLVVSIDEPHHPFICPEPFVSEGRHYRKPLRNGDDPLLDKPRAQRDWAAHVERRVRAAVTREADGTAWFSAPGYYACNRFTDFEIGRVLDAIDAAVPGALVVHTSDHGDLFGSHRLLGKGPVAYDEASLVPLIVRWPGHAPSGATSAGPASHVDLVPTFLDYFGIPVPPLLQGRSLLPQVADPAARVNDVVFTEFFRFEVDHDGFGSFAPFRAVTDGRLKLVVNLVDTDELYDLEADPLELVNRVHDPALAAARDALHDRLLAWQGETRDPMRGPQWRARPWRAGPRGSTWGGPTRPRPFDEAFEPRTLLYDDIREATERVYDKD